MLRCVFKGNDLRRKLGIASFDRPVFADEKKFLRSVVFQDQFKRLLKPFLPIAPFDERHEGSVENVAETIDLDA